MYQTILLFFILMALGACSSDSAHPSEQNSNGDNFIEIEGMRHLTGGTVTIGSNDKSFKASEKPAMNVELDYDFYMDIHEVTCSDYAKVAKKAELKTFGKCQSDSLPLVDVTYYDAILYANAKSKLENYDTAYSYSSATFDNDGHCINLESLSFDTKAKAFRLPTEAEWVFAATRAWDTDKSWNSENSGFKLQPVCGMGIDSAGFCDMFGNAMEWVNDWMGMFRDTTITNYVGAPDGGNLAERILKGGSYNYSAKDFSPYSRGDVYAVTSATRAKYVGFRLAFGNIPNALWMSDNGKIAESFEKSLVHAETIKKQTGSYNVKLVYRSDISGNIAYLDYNNDPPTIKEITQGIDAYHPEISPDGKWLAFCTGIEGLKKQSTIYVQSIDDDSEHRIKLNVKSAAIPRWRVLSNGDTVIVYVTDAGSNEDETTFKSASTWQVSFMNKKFGTPQKLFDGAYHGGISEDNTLAVTGAKLLRARIAKQGSTLSQKAQDVIWYDNAQACNVSLVQDGTKRTAFLDFAGEPGKKFVGKKYAIHERILIADSTGKLIQSIKAPSGSTFDHTEWATDGTRSIITATLANLNGAHTKIALVNPSDSSVISIVEGDELWHPSLWIKRKAVKHSSSSSISSSSSSVKSVSSSSSSSSVKGVSSSSSSSSVKGVSSSSSSSSVKGVSSSGSSSSVKGVSSSSSSSSVTSVSSSSSSSSITGVSSSSSSSSITGVSSSSSSSSVKGISSSSSSSSVTSVSSSSSSSSVTSISSSSSSSSVTSISSSSSENKDASSSSSETYTFELDPDSAGIYYVSYGPNKDADQWRYKMEFLWQYKDKANLIVLGSSRGYNGVNPLLFNKSIFALNLAVSKNFMPGTDYFFNNYILPHMKNLKYIVLTVDNDLWHTTESFFTSEYRSYPGYVYDANHNFWKDGVPEDLAELTYESLGNSKGPMLRSTRGFYGVTSATWGTTKIETDSNWLASKRDIYYQNFEKLKDMIQKCHERNIILIGVITPRNPKYKETGSFGSHGLLRSEAPALIQEIADLSKTYPNFILMDENKMGDHDYTENMAFDMDHLNQLGAKHLTERLDSLLQTLE